MSGQSLNLPNEEQYLTELAAMMGDDVDVDAIEQASPVKAPEPRQSEVDQGTAVPQPTVIDPTSNGEGEGTNDATPAGGELSDDGSNTDPDGLPFTLPPTGFDQTASPGGTDGGVEPTGASYEPTSTPPSIDLNNVARQVFGSDVTEDQARQVFRLAKDFEKLNPAQLQAIESMLTGGGLPYQQPIPQPVYPQQPIQQPIPQQQPIPPQQIPGGGYAQQGYQQPAYQIPEEIDPELAQVLGPVVAHQKQLEYQLAQQQELLNQQAQYRMQQEQQAAYNAADAAGKSWREAMQQDGLLSPEEYLLVEQRALESGLLPAFNQQYGDAGKAVTETLNHIFFTDPEFRNRVVAKEMEKAQKEAIEQSRRTNVSTALSGGGGAKPMNAGAPKTPGTPAPTNMASLVDGVREILNGGMPA